MLTRLGCTRELKDCLFLDSPGISETERNLTERDTLRLRLIRGMNSLTLLVERNTTGNVTYTVFIFLAR